MHHVLHAASSFHFASRIHRQDRSRVKTSRRSVPPANANSNTKLPVGRPPFCLLPTQKKNLMKIALLSTAALTAATTCYAFAPSSSHSSNQRTTTRSFAPLNSSAISAVPISKKIPNPYQNLPWVTEREEKRKQRRLTHDNAALFRELGLPEDATYEDVASKTKHLISLTEDLPKNEGIKKRIKIEIARDKIYQIRLNERISGVRAEQDDAARVSKLEEEGVEGL